MSEAPTLERVAALVARVAGPQPRAGAAGPDTALTGGGFWLDSVRLLEALLSCEEAFGIVFDPETDFTGENLRSVRSLFELVRSRYAG